MNEKELSKLFRAIIKTVKTKKLGNDHLMGTAYHEAGHALADYLHGFTPATVTIIPDYSKLTFGSYKNCNDVKYGCTFGLECYLTINSIEWSNDKILEYYTMTYMAGIIGEAFYFGKYSWYPASGDFNGIVSRFLAYGITDIPDLQPYWDKTFNLIEDNVSLLHSIANDLYKHKTLEAEYFNQLKTTP